MFQIENEHLLVTINSAGAELKRVFGKQIAIDYLWDANPAYWAKTSPVLFPVVGTLKQHTYYYNGQAYHLPRHGFARDSMFQVMEHLPHAITFTLESSLETQKLFPFSFLFSISYALLQNELKVTYRVENKDNKTLLFSVGAHPAFKVPLVEGTAYDDYRLVFEKKETAGRWPISPDGLIERAPEAFLNQSREIALSKELFAKDAIVLKNLQSGWVRLSSDKTPHGLQFSFQDFPYLGLWAAPNADFLCIEPWYGIADSVESTQQLDEKEGIIKLKSKENFSGVWSVAFY